MFHGRVEGDSKKKERERGSDWKEALKYPYAKADSIKEGHGYVLQMLSQFCREKNPYYIEHQVYLLPENVRTENDKNQNQTEKLQLIFAMQQITEIYQSDRLAGPSISLLMFLISVQRCSIYQLFNHLLPLHMIFQPRQPEGSSLLIHIRISIAISTPRLEDAENQWLGSRSYRGRQGVDRGMTGKLLVGIHARDCCCQTFHPPDCLKT